jgi:hypothetical protein
MNGVPGNPHFDPLLQPSGAGQAAPVLRPGQLSFARLVVSTTPAMASEPPATVSQLGISFSHTQATAQAIKGCRYRKLEIREAGARDRA